MKHLKHFQTNSSTVRCRLPMRNRYGPGTNQHGWDLGDITTDPSKVTCPDCKAGRCYVENDSCFSRGMNASEELGGF